ncbi:hypothetical protein BE20_06440 [Sorangium cellulosum]|uniref:Uncharacterized protein n=1 Tax=Sorangium cellulosum TaxID=56 RepID=A0A150SQ00_SORCE|nr:hypothetical protein BE18_14945 [Sorangium cellulosum]KYF94515.1 hypothetical protein BE20_06440 [Sorangium cellulosum]
MFPGARIVPIVKQPLGLKGDQSARRVAPPFELRADDAGRGEHVLLATRVGDGLTASSETVGAEPNQAVLEDDLGDMCSGETPFEGRTAAPPDWTLDDAGAVDAQVDVLVAAV